MSNLQQRPLPELSNIFEEIVRIIDISESQYQLAVRSYEAVGNHLDADGSPLQRFRPQIRPQGSLRYGTVIKPIQEGEEYDVDLTCQLTKNIGPLTQYELKKIIGDRLIESKDYKRMMGPERRRCWRLHYAESTKFHLDVVPAIPDPNMINKLVLLGVPLKYAQHALSITDNETWNYKLYAGEFPKSNPEGYAIWFQDRMLSEFIRQKRMLAESLRAQVDDVPDFKVKTPLQRSVQLLKRHRDLRMGDNDDKPVSIIITTLSALAYRNESDIYQSLVNILLTMDRYITRDIRGNYFILNPVNPNENFADKWNECPSKAEKFFEWLRLAQQDFAQITSKRGLHEIANASKPILGEGVVKEAFSKISQNQYDLSRNGQLKMQAATGILSTSGQVSVRKHTFFGDDF